MRVDCHMWRCRVSRGSVHQARVHCGSGGQCQPHISRYQASDEALQLHGPLQLRYLPLLHLDVSWSLRQSCVHSHRGVAALSYVFLSLCVDGLAVPIIYVFVCLFVSVYVSIGSCHGRERGWVKYYCICLDEAGNNTMVSWAIGWSQEKIPKFFSFSGWKKLHFYDQWLQPKVYPELFFPLTSLAYILSRLLPL